MSNVQVSTEVALLRTMFEKISVEVDFKAEWHNGTGYLDQMAEDVLVYDGTTMPSGMLFKSQTDEARPRKIIGVVTPVGNVIFFEHHEYPDNMVSLNRSYVLSALFPSVRVMDGGELRMVMGGEDFSNRNLGTTLRMVVGKANRNQLAHPGNMPGFPSLTGKDHADVAIRVATRCAQAGAESIDVNAIWNEEYHRTLLAKDFEGDEVGSALLEVRNPALVSDWNRSDQPGLVRTQMFGQGTTIDKAIVTEGISARRFDEHAFKGGPDLPTKSDTE